MKESVKQKFKWVVIAWCVNAMLFLLAWFGGDILLNEGYAYFKDSIETMRITLGITKICLSFGLFICIAEG